MHSFYFLAPFSNDREEQAHFPYFQFVLDHFSMCSLNSAI